MVNWYDVTFGSCATALGYVFENTDAMTATVLYVFSAWLLFKTGRKIVNKLFPWVEY